MGFLSGLKRYFNIQNQCNSPYQQVNKKDNMLISIDTEKAFKNLLYIPDKSLQKIRNRRVRLHLDKGHL